MWENNLGPFWATLQQWTKRGVEVDLTAARDLLVVYVDRKPAEGPKAPRLLDTLLQTFTTLPLINASKLRRRTCFEHAFVGISARSFDHGGLLRAMQVRVTGRSHDTGSAPASPSVLWVSRNHASVTRGRKVANEAAAVEAAAAVVLSATGSPLQAAHMQDFPFTEQVRMVMGIQILLGPHGAGIANCIWMRPGSVAAEFVAPVGRTLFSLYKGMCRRSGVRHVGVVAEADPADAGTRLSNPRLYSNMVIPRGLAADTAGRALEMYRRG
eukprot:TRINITY_DN14822_c0_g1_i3.p2 TRINITY_DN14822_c0_g1~~TRINITY_DN14822_c0_g1_i3.p2  ORF type:complete len:269 (+),score=67.74 TRINITY_DN14822_c0_g1_i3:639-1445(+)